MTSSSQKLVSLFPKEKPLRVILLLGVLWTFFLQTYITDEVIFTSDCGLKLLMVHQFSSGDLAPGARPPTEPWVYELWMDGFIPYKQPFAYLENRRIDFTYNFLFPMMTAPFYKMLEFRGLYVIPILSVWLSWLVFCKFMQHWNLSSIGKSAALIGFVFANPFTAYTGLFWEHSIAVLVVLCGLHDLGTIIRSGSSPMKLYFRSGFWIGLSIWFRPESYAFGLACVLVLIIHCRNFITKKMLLYFLFGMGVIVFALWVGNYWYSQHPLGAHARQIVEHARKPIWIRYFHNLRDITPLLATSPLILLFVGLPVINSSDRPESQWTKVVSSLMLLFFLIVLAILPNGGGFQIGPRYLLVLMPLIAAQGVWIAERLIEQPERKSLGTAALIITLSLGTLANTIPVVLQFQDQYQTLKLPRLKELREEPNDILVVSADWIPLEFAAIVKPKQYLLANKREKFIELVPKLWENGCTDFTFISPNARPVKVDDITSLKGIKVTFDAQGDFHIYHLWRVHLEELSDQSG